MGQAFRTPSNCSANSGTNSYINNRTISSVYAKKVFERDEEVAPFALDIVQAPINGGSQRVGDATCHIVEKSEGHDSSFVGQQHYRQFST